MAPDGGDLGNNNGPSESSFNPAVAGSLLGGANLQKSIDSNTKAMDDLADQIKSMGGSATFSKQGPTSQTATGMGNSIHQMMGGVNGGQSMPLPNLGQMGSNSGQGPVFSQPQPMGGGANGSSGGGGGPSAGGGGGFSNNGSSNMLGAAIGGGGAAGVFGAFANSANKALPNQVALNSYETTGSYMSNQSQQKIGSSLLGSGGSGYLNMAQSLPDALAMGSTIAQASGSPIAGMGGPGTNALSRSMYGGAAGTALTNPGMSGAAAASANAALFSPMTSWRMRLMGMQTPLSMGGGKALSQAQVFNSFNQNPHVNLARASVGQYASSMRQGAKGYEDVLSTLAGGNAQFAQADISTMEAEHKLSLKGWSPGKIQNAFSAVEKTGPGTDAAKKQLEGAGFKIPDIQKMQAALAPNAARTSDQSAGFNKGLTAATSTVAAFNKALASMMKSSGLDKYAGAASGAASATNSLEPGFMHTAASAVSKIPVVGSFLGGAINALGGGDTPVSTTPAAPASTDAVVPSAKIGTTPKAASASSVTRQAIEAVNAARGQVGVPYKWGAETPGKGFDCAGLTQWAYKKAGVNIPRTASQQWAALQAKQVPLNKVEEGDLVFSGGTSGPKGVPGHVGMMISGNKLIQAPQSGGSIGIIGFNAAAWQHAVRPTGSTNTQVTAKPAGGAGPASPAGANGATIPASASGGNSPGGASGVKGLGDILSGGSSSEKSSFLQGVTGGVKGGSGYTGQNNGSLIDLGGTSGSTPAGGTTPPSGSGGQEVYNYILNNIFHGNKIAAAGALASMWGESSPPGWNPESKGSGGFGIMGWTSGVNGADISKQQTGNVAKDMAAQLALMLPWIDASGDQGAIQSMMSASTVEQAALIWGTKVERFGVSDIHAQGIAAAKQIAGLAAGGAGAEGQVAWVGERGPELIRFGSDAHVMNAAQTQKIAKSSMAQSPQAPFTSGVTSPFAYAPQHSVYSGGKGSQGGFNNQVVLQFDENSIAIKMPTGTTDTGQSGRAMAEAFVNQISTTELYKKIAQGKKT
jgi:cell wall-associated NlpC family hydrolase